MNFIENIEIKNFKSIRHARIEGCKRINVFVGPPNVGKSNILEAMSLLCYSADKTHISFKDLVRYDELTELFFDGTVDEAIIISVEDNTGLLSEKYSLNIGYEENGNLLLKFSESGPVNNAHKVGVSKIAFSITKSGSVSHEYYKGQNQKNYSGLSVKKYLFSQTSFKEEGSAKKLDFPKGNNLFQVLMSNTKTKQVAVELFSKYGLKLLIDKSTNDFRLVKQFDTDVIYPIPFYQMADTLQRLLFYLTAVLTNEDSVLLFEEPESHMYPVYISKFTGQMMYDKNNNQFFLATHSPYVLNDLLDQVREEVAIYICSYVNGETVIQRMTDEEMLEAAQYGHDFFMNLENFVKS